MVLVTSFNEVFHITKQMNYHYWGCLAQAEPYKYYRWFEEKTYVQIWIICESCTPFKIVGSYFKNSFFCSFKSFYFRVCLKNEPDLAVKNESRLGWYSSYDDSSILMRKQCVLLIGDPLLLIAKSGTQWSIFHTTELCFLKKGINQKNRLNSY